MWIKFGDILLNLEKKCTLVQDKNFKWNIVVDESLVAHDLSYDEAYEKYLRIVNALEKTSAKVCDITR